MNNDDNDLKQEIILNILEQMLVKIGYVYGVQKWNDQLKRFVCINYYKNLSEAEKRIKQINSLGARIITLRDNGTLEE